MNFKKMLLFLIAPLAVMMNSCNTPEGPEYTLPIIKVTDVEGGVEINSLSLASEGGNKTFVITSTRGWEITNQAEWLAVNPLKVTNEMLTEQVTTVTLTAPANDGAARTEVLKVKMESKEVSITVTQAGAGQVELGKVLYYDNFDKEGKQAQKGSSGWDTYMDQEAGQQYCNPTPENQAGVTYTGTKLTVRSNSSNGSAGTHSNYKGSGMNYLWFGTAPTNLTVSGISLAELEGNALTFSFGTERYEYNATDNTFKPEEFHVYISGDGEKWSEISYTFVEDANTNGKWNEATAQFNLKEVPEKLYIYMTATVGAAYAVDDLKLTAGGGGTEIDLAAGSTIDGLNPGGGSGDNGGDQGSEPDPNAQQVTVQQFLDAEEDDTLYLLTGTISGNVTSHYGNFDLTDETGTVYIYGLVDGNNKFVWDSLGLQVGDTITIQGTRTSYNDTPQMKNALYISHVKGEGNEEPEPPVAGDGDYASDSPFVQAADNSTNCVYTLGDSKVNGQAATGFKLGKSKQQGKFTSKAIGVSGDKYLNFYAVSWGAGGDQTIYFRVNGGEAMSQAIKANSGATGNPPYTITVTDTDHYSVLLSGLSESDVIEFSSNAAFDCAATTDYATRAIFFGVKLTDEPIGGTTETPDPEEPEEPETPEGVVKATVAEFLAAAEDATVYELTGTIKGTYNTYYGNFYLEDETAEVLIYGIVKDGEKCYEALGLKDGDIVTIQGTRASYNGAAQMKNAEYISHVEGETPEPEPEPEPAVGPYASDSSFVQATDNSTNKVYSLGDTTIDGNAVTGFKLGTSNNAGFFTSKAVGVSGDKTLGFYAVAWKDKSATLYYRVDGGEVKSQALAAHDGATGNPPFSALTARESDHYSVALTGLTENSIIEFSTDATFSTASNTNGRAIVFGVKLGEGGITEPEPEEPEQPEQPEPSDVMTIADVLATEGALAEGTFVEGVVISNMALNNLTSKKGMYIQDETAGLQFYLAANHEFAFGDKVKIDLSGVTVGAYNGAVQVSGVALDKITKISSDNAVEAKTVSIADFLANKYEGQYVAIEGVQVAAADLSKTWVMGGSHTSINIEDANGNKFVVFSSKYATYGANTVAQGSGTIKGISSINNGNMQIIFGQESDFAGLTGDRFGATVEPETPTEPEEPVAGEWAGRDDFKTVAHNSSYINRTTTAGWVATYCAVQSGGPNDANPVLPSLLGSSSDTRAFCIKGAGDGVGTITSPVLNGGIGKLKFNYGLAFTDKNGVDMDVTIMQNGEAVKTINVKTACGKYEVQSFEQEINIAGDFHIVFTNNCPSAAASGNKDRISIWDVMWTACAE